ncbi:2-C-methyl-D-erythritol 4-phosphate cytidylyltransferase [Thorsellia kenyensis]|uniref:2-C-methyl-D-erythritol 4-phosphate cytidylyltransferase n=1 Tax=Thorsellia kenyensis TaxID=1549888 RepID=A0ABV6CAG8_9GAMM
MSINLTYEFIVIIPAAGMGSRMQATLPKQYLNVMGQTILTHTVNALSKHPKLVKFIIAVSKNDSFIHQIPFCDKISIDVIEGGEERADSVLSGVSYAQKKYQPKWILVHDAARPLITKNDVECLIDSLGSEAFYLTQSIGAILATPLKDTIKKISHLEHGIYTEKTEPREKLWAAQTPQIFPTKTLLDALYFCKKEGLSVTDEASAIELFGGRTFIVQGSSSNIKLTEPADLEYIKFVLNKRLNQLPS